MEKSRGSRAGIENLIRLGAYRRGSNPEVDEAISYRPMLEAFPNQGKVEQTSLGAVFPSWHRY